ncbi:Mucin-2 [Camelus dromedarius]|uniref:Mucin-2 n=1 Tax=Camelus dromedarius TaxID=9838 RepID=A0A5N4BY82_CAMDR|nr:Mucin-2 [Camelus dromedarius]
MGAFAPGTGPAQPPRPLSPLSSAPARKALGWHPVRVPRHVCRYGNGHYITFDGKYYDFDGHCSYVAVQTTVAKLLAGSSHRHRERPCGTTASPARTIKIFLVWTPSPLRGLRPRLVLLDDTGGTVSASAPPWLLRPGVHQGGGLRDLEDAGAVPGIHSNISVSYLEVQPCATRLLPRCPKNRPIYDEDLKKCVRGDECGCYIEDTRYDRECPCHGEALQSCECTKSSKVVCGWKKVELPWPEALGAAAQESPQGRLNYTRIGPLWLLGVCAAQRDDEKHLNIAGPPRHPLPTYHHPFNHLTPPPHLECDAGRWVCTDLQCPGTCALEGGAHISTFDGRKYTFHGDCYYVLSKDAHNDSYAVLGELTSCGSTDKQTCLKTVVLLADSKKNVVAFKSDGSVLLNELQVNLPHVTASFSIFQPSSHHLLVSTAFGLRLQVQLLPVMQLFLTLDPAAQGHVQGLCGNFNGLEGDDFQTAGGLVEATGAGFANTWKAQSSCQDKVDWLDDPCSLSIESANYAEHWCSLLKKTEAPFGRCHSAVDPAEYYKARRAPPVLTALPGSAAQRCKYDTCNCQNSEDCMCAALSSYAHACAAKGVLLWGWREGVCSECHKDVGSCPTSQLFLYNLTTCQRTCRSLSESDTRCLKGFLPVDGCGCPDQAFLDEKGRCVPLAKCSCYHHGLYLEAGEVVLRQEERCVCQNGRLLCKQVRLIDQNCMAPKIHVDCNNLTALAIRNPRAASCQTLAAGSYQTECISGCVCPEGLLDDGQGGCVVEEQCPCVHNSDVYPPGAKIRVDCNTCTCQKGRWACTQSVCHGTCAVYGNGHYITFDGKYYDFDGHCSYVAVQDYCGQNSSLGSFSIVTENVPCGTTGVTCSKSIKIFLGRTELKLEDRHCTVIPLDVGHHVAYTTREVGQYLVVEASTGVIVIWDKRTTIFIKLAPSYKGTVCGLCGNFDQRSSNDFTTRDRMVVESELDFGNSWKEASTCPDVSSTPEPCTLNWHRRSWAEKQCSIIKSWVFRTCHSKVDPKPFYEACVHDSCSCDTGGDCECFCSAVASYAQECTKEGACVTWRTPELCPVFCDYYNPPHECEWHYEPCGNRSFETCRSLSGIHSNISVSYLEGEGPPGEAGSAASGDARGHPDTGCVGAGDPELQAEPGSPSCRVCSSDGGLGA